MNVGQAVDAIVEDSSLRSGTRGTLVLVEAVPSLASTLERAIGDRLGNVMFLLFDGSIERTRELEQLNRGRDSLLRGTRALVVACPSPTLLRQARSVATDLLTAPDLTLQVHVQVAADWSALSSRLRQVMVERHRYLDLTGLLPRDVAVRKVPLEELYIDLLEEPEPDPDTLGVERYKRPLQAAVGEYVPLGFDEEDEESKPVVVLAQPGAGKTTLLRHEVNAITEGSSTLFVQGRVPVLVPLAGYAAARRERALPLLDYCEAFAGEAVGEARLPLRDHPEDVVLLLDGLDEIPERVVRRRVLDEVVEWSTKHGLEQVLLTSRSYLSPELERVRSRLDVRTLRPANRDDIQGFLRAFAELRGREQDPTRLVERITQDRSLTELARNPLLLVFLAVLDDVDRDLPGQRTVLYRDLTELLISRWQPRRNPGTAHRRRLKRGDAIRVLGPLGWWMVSRGGQPASEAELLSELTRIEQKREPDPELARTQAADRLAQLKEETALLFHDGRYAFAHLSFAEYFAGVEAARDPDRRKVLEADPYSPDWREVVRFTLVLLTDIECRDAEARSLAKALIARSKRPGRYDSKIPKLLSDIALEGPSLPSDLQEAMVERNTRISLLNSLVEDEARKAREALVEVALDSRGGWSSAVQSAMVRSLDDRGPAPVEDDPLVRRLPALVESGGAVAGWVRRALPSQSSRWLSWVVFYDWTTELGSLSIFHSALNKSWWSIPESRRSGAIERWAAGALRDTAMGIWRGCGREPIAPEPDLSTTASQSGGEPYWRFVEDATGVPAPTTVARRDEQLIAALSALL